MNGRVGDQAGAGVQAAYTGRFSIGRAGGGIHELMRSRQAQLCFCGRVKGGE